MWSGEECATTDTVRVGKAGDLLASFDFSGRLGQHSYPCVSRNAVFRLERAAWFTEPQPSLDQPFSERN